MQDVNVTGQAYQNRGSGDGSTQGPNDGQDYVQASTVLAQMQDATNTLAYLTALGLGQYRAPPNQQPGSVTANGRWSGWSRIQHINPVLSPGDLTFIGPSFEGDVLNVSELGLYVYADTYGALAWVSGETLSAGHRRVANNQMWALIETGSGGVVGTNAPPGTAYSMTTLGTFRDDNGAIWANITAQDDDLNYSDVTVSAWVASTGYDVGVLVSNLGGWFRCITAGQSAGSGGPSGTSQNITDGTAHWAALFRVPQWVRNTSRGSQTVIAPSLSSIHWSADDSLGYWKDQGGAVHIQGSVVSDGDGSTPQTAFVLPIGYRPATGTVRAFTCPTLSGVLSNWHIDDTGAVILLSPFLATTATTHHLDPFCFLAEN